MAIYYVENTGSNVYPFDSRATAAPSFYALFLGLNAHSISYLYSYDTVYVNGHIYEPGGVTYYLSGCSIIGTDPLTDIIDMSDCVFDGVAYNGFNIRNLTISTYSYCPCYNPTEVIGCRFEGNFSAYYAIRQNSAITTRIIGNTFYGFYSPVYVFGGDELSNEGFTIIANSVYSYSHGIRIDLYNTSIDRFYMYNNAIYTISPDACFRVEFTSMSIGDFVHSNNVGNQGYYYRENTVPFSPDVSEITADPQFPATGANPLSVSVTSPCYHAGITTAYSPTVDILGEPYDDPPTVGAYEIIKYVKDCYWDVETSGLLTSDGGEGKTTEEMQHQSTFTNWDFPGVWKIRE
jgi:hypothetical protein